jgi:membrane fusion protein
MQLFREEVLSGQMGTPPGALRVSRPSSFTVVTAATVLLGVALVSFAAWGEVTRKATLNRLLLPALGSLAITTPQGGVIAERYVAEGDTVAQGQTLFGLDLATTQAAAVQARSSRRRSPHGARHSKRNRASSRNWPASAMLC